VTAGGSTRLLARSVRREVVAERAADGELTVRKEFLARTPLRRLREALKSLVRRAASQREARCLWAKAHLLWARGGLGPRPVACLTRGDELRLWLARDATSRTLLQSADSPEAQRAAIVLIDRLLALGRLDPWLSTRKIVVVRRPDGGLRAQLIDPSAFRAARPIRHRRRERARALLAERLGEVQQLREILRESTH